VKAKDNGVLHYRVMDVQRIEEPVTTTDLNLVPESFDAVFSNAALHWCKKSPSSVVQNAWNALKPGGRFVAEMGGFTNVVGRYTSTLVDDWGLPDLQRCAR
jgi:SAM-dependent methyltransferase